MVETGQKAPTFSLSDNERKERSLEEFMGKKTVLAFFPGAFTSVCMKEACILRDEFARLTALEAQVVGITVDSPFANNGFAQANNLNFPVLSDYSRSTLKEYGVLHKDFLGLNGYDVAVRSIFVLDRTGIVRYKWIAEDPGKEPNYEEIYNELEAIKM